jgi:hypothetical protein
MVFKRSSSRCRMFSSSGNELRRVHVKQFLLLLLIRTRTLAIDRKLKLIRIPEVQLKLHRPRIKVHMLFEG